VPTKGTLRSPVCRGVRNFPVILQKVATRFYGSLFLAPTRLYFVSGKQGYAWGGGSGMVDAMVTASRNEAAATNVATAVGAASPATLDEDGLRQAALGNKGSIIFEAPELALIRHDWWWCGFKWKDGKKIGVAKRFPPELVRELGLWAAANQVPSKGLG
jgi:hypothetical protein